MNANKIIFALYSSNYDYCVDNNLTYEGYKKIYENTPAYVLLCDEKVITKCKNADELYQKGLTNGCFIDTQLKDSPEELEENVNYLQKKYKIKSVSNDEFKEIESKKQLQRVKKAFATAEKMIADEEEMDR